MISVKEDQVVPIVLAIYNRSKLYRPHLSEENRCELVQKKMLKDYGVTVTSEDLKKIVEVQQNLTSAAALRNNKTETQEGKYVNNAGKRRSFTFRDIPLVETRYENIQETKRRSFTFRDIPFVKTSYDSINESKNDQDDNEVSINSNTSHFTTRKVLNTSKIPIPISKYGRRQPIGRNKKSSNMPRNESKTTKRQLNTSNDKPDTNVFERLYALRPRPCPQTVELVKKVRQIFTSKPASKQPLKTKTCISHEPPSKRVRKECLNVPVFERLYAERKQLNTKKLTDVQKRELYLKKQREELRKTREQWKKSQEICNCGCSATMESPTSDFDMNDSASDTDEHSDNTDLTVVNFSDSVLNLSTMKCDVFNSTTKTEDDYDSKNVHDLLNSLAQRFNERMSLCVVNDSDLAD